jgi:hypothetical protein
VWALQTDTQVLGASAFICALLAETSRTS